MTRSFDLLVFDWDGTLADSAAIITAAVQAACRDLELPVPADRDARHIIGLGLRDALLALLPELGESRYPEFVECYRRHFFGREAEIMLFPGALQLAHTLKEEGYLLAIATGKSRNGLDRALKSSGLHAYFHASRCADECFSKPHPEMLFQLMHALEANPARTLMIGDTTHDVQMAANANVPMLAVGYGAHPKDTLLALNPLDCIDSLTEFRSWLAAKGYSRKPS